MTRLRSWISTLLIMAMLAEFLPAVQVTAQEAEAGNKATVINSAEVVLSGTSEVLEDGTGLYEVYAAEGDTVSFGPTIMGQSDASYQWQKWNDVTGEYEDIPVHTKELTIRVSEDDVNRGARYRCLIKLATSSSTAEFAIIDEIPVCESLEEMVQLLQEQIKVRKQYFTAILAEENVQIHNSEMTELVFAHTGDPKGGDYMANHCTGFRFHTSSVDQGTEFRFTMDGYLTSAAQEAAMDGAVRLAVEEILKDTEGYQQYEILGAIFDYINANVAYDSYHFNNVFDYFGNMTKQTAYGALIDGTAVCEGIASLFYRLSLECGVDCRMISGGSVIGRHVWNLADATGEGDYYIVDATHGRLLNGEWTYEEALFPDEEYLTDEFKAAYPMHYYNLCAYMSCEDLSYTYDQATQTLVLHSDIPRVLAWNLYWPEEMRQSVKHLILDEGVTRIGDNAFEQFTALTSVTMADNVKVLGNRAFYFCESLEKLTLSDTLKKIGKYCFDGIGYHSIEIELPDSVTTIDDGAFRAFCGFARIDISRNSKLTYIGDYAFESCNFTNFYIPPNVTYLGSHAFDNCGMLTDVEFAEECKLTQINECTFSGCTGLKEIDLPDSIVSIGDYAFCNCEGFLELSIPENVSTIGNYAFARCFNLLDVKLPKNLISIGDYAFDWCVLRSVHIPAKVMEIGNSAFGRNHLASISLDRTNPYYKLVDGVLYSADMKKLVAFPNYAEWTSYTIPEGVETIPDSAFYLSALETIDLPDSLLAIPDRAFSNCDDLVEITIPKNVVSIGEHAFEVCSKLSSITIPGNVKTIGDYAFYGNMNALKTIVLEEGVQRIGYEGIGVYPDAVVKLPVSLKYLNGRVFGTSNLPQIVYAGTEKQWLDIERHDDSTICSGYVTFAGDPSQTVSFDCNGGEGSFGDLTLKEGDAYGTLPVPTREGYNFYGWFTEPSGGVKITEQTIPGTRADHTLYAHWEDTLVASGEDGDMVWFLHKNGELAVAGIGVIPDYDWLPAPWADMREEIRSITVYEGITHIGHNAFADCSAAASISLPETLKGIGNSAFERCVGIETLDLPESVLSIGDFAFRACDGITELKLPDNLERIGDNAFALMGNLETAEIPARTTSFGATVFYQCGKLKSVRVRTQNALLGPGMFTGCTSLSEVILADGLTGIGIEAFKNCASLKNLVLPDSVTQIGPYAFAGCTGLETVDLGYNVRVIEYSAFYGCSSLHTISLPAVLKEIDSFAFANCTSLEELDLPVHVAYLGHGAFSGCTGLTSVEIPFGLEVIGTNAFRDCTNLETVYYGADIGNIPIGMFSGCTALNAVHMTSKVTEIFEKAFENCGALSDIWWNHSEQDWNTVRIEEGNEALQNAQLHCQAGNTYPVTLDACGGTTQTDTIQVSYNGFYGELPIPVRDGFRFKGWFTAPTGGSAVTATTTVTKATAHTLYAQWWGAETSGTFGGNLEWTFFGDGTLKISGIGSLPTFSEAPWESLKQEIRHLIISDGITSISDNAFEEYLTLKTIDVAPSVEKIGASAFLGCDAITELSLPEGVKTIGDYAFADCDNLIYAELPPGCDDLGVRVFAGCDELHSAVVHGTGSYMFFECYKLQELTIGEGAPYVADNTCFSCHALRKVSLPSTAKVIEEYAFYSVGALKEVVFSEGLVEIERYAFYGSNPRVVNVPGTVTRIDASAFSHCGIEVLSIPESVTEMAENAFVYCGSLKSLELNAQCKVLDYYVLSGGAFSKVVIPECVEIIDHAFCDNASLREIVFCGDAVTFRESRYTRLDDGMSGITAKVYYPDDNPSWTEDMFVDHGGTLTWLPWYTLGDDPECEHECVSQQVTMPEGCRYTLYTCACGYSYRSDFQHVHPSVTDPAVDATCTETGLTEGSHCSGCQMVLVAQKATPPLGHSCTYKRENEIQATCETAGSYDTVLYCIFCNEEMSRETVITPATGHSFGQWYTVKAADDTFPGLSQRDCATCGSSETGAFTTTAAGTCGAQLEWVLTGTEKLWIFGTGTMDTWNSGEDIPWSGYAAEVVSLQINAGVTQINDFTFSNLSGLRAVTIPKGVTRIGSEAFAHCSGLLEITFLGAAPEIGTDAFRDVAATVYYSGGDASWTEERKQSYGGTLTWAACVFYDILEEGTDTVVEAGKEFSIHIDADHTTLTAVCVNEELVDPANYTVTQGSTVVTFTAEYLATLQAGIHDVVIHFEGGRAFCTIEVPYAAPAGMKGDLNLDGIVNSDDLTLLARHVGGIEIVEGQALANADVNGDGQVNSDDLTKHARFVGGIITSWDQE